MKKIEIQQSSKATCSYPSGSALVGSLVDKQTTLSQLNEVGGHSKISLRDVVKPPPGFLATGKSDFNPVRGVSKDAWFREAMGIGTTPFKGDRKAAL